MSKFSTFRGNKIRCIDNKWFFESGESVEETWRSMPCGHCGEKRTSDKHDACLGALPGVMNACCGHGKLSDMYLQFTDGSIINGIMAKNTIIKIKKENRMQKSLTKHPKVICFTNGFPNSGKDPFQAAVIRHMPSYSIKKISTVDIHKVAAALFGYTGVKDEKERKLLNNLKTASKAFNNFPVNNTNKRLQQPDYNGCDIVFVDCREARELEEFKRFWQGNFYSVFVSRELESKHWGNPADDLDEKAFAYDYQFYNDIDPETMIETKELNEFIGIMERMVKHNS